MWTRPIPPAPGPTPWLKAWPGRCRWRWTKGLTPPSPGAVLHARREKITLRPVVSPSDGYDTRPPRQGRTVTKILCNTRRRLVEILSAHAVDFPATPCFPSRSSGVGVLRRDGVDLGGTYAMTAPAFVTSLAAFGERIALVDEIGERLTYAALAKLVDGLAESLGTRRRLVMVEVASSIPSVVAYLAALRGGHGVIVAKPGDLAKEGATFSRFRPSAVHRAGSNGFSVLHGDDPELHPELSALYSTSGSTGSAKLVRLSARNIQSNAESIAEYLEIDEHEIAPTALPLSYSYGASILSSHLCRGACVVLTEHSVVDPEFAALLERERCTSLSGVPYTWELILQAGLLTRDWPHLKTLTQAGGKMPSSRVQEIAAWARARGKRFYVMYGQTECTARMAYLPWEFASAHADCVGVAIPGGNFHLIDDSGNVLDGVNVRGQLVYTGPNVMMGYATSREELALPAGNDERITGDLAERNTLGLYRIVGRVSRFSKIMGLRISLDEVETMVQRRGCAHPAVAGNDRLIAICINKSEGMDASALEAAIAAECGIPPGALVVVEVDGDVPHLDNGKVDYVEILRRAQAITEERESRTLGLRDEIARLLGLKSIQDEESFAGLGGDSLTYIQASLAIERRLGYLPPDWEQVPIHMLEAHESAHRPDGVAATATDKGKALVSSAVDVDVPLRALATMFVVYNHSHPMWLPGAPGAMAVLLLLVGKTLARFRGDSLFRGEGLVLVRTTFIRYVLPYLALLCVYLVVKRELDIPSLLLVSTFVDSRAGTFLQPFWFIEVFFHVTLILAAVFSIGPLRSAIASRPLVWGLGAVGGMGALHVISNKTGNPLPPVALWSGIVALGWCVHFARSMNERVLLSLASLAMPWLAPRGYEVAVVLLLVIWVPRVTLFFEPLKQLVGRIGSASFQIYLLHGIVVTALGMVPGVRGSWIFPALAIPLSLAAGIAFNALPPWKTWLPEYGAARLRSDRRPQDT